MDIDVNVKSRINKVILYSTTLSIIIITAIVGIFLIFNEHYNFKQHISRLKDNFILKERQKLIVNMDVLIKNLSLEKSFMFKNKKDNLKKELLQRYNLVENIYNRYHETYTKSVIIEIVKKSLRNLSYLEKFKNYFLLNSDGLIILNTSNASLEGTNLVNIRDIYGTAFVRGMIDKSLQNENGAYFSYKWIGVNSSQAMNKLNFVRYFKPLDIVIGAGFYENSLLSDIQSSLKAKINNDKGNLKTFSSYYKINFFHVPFGPKKFALLKASNKKKPSNQSLTPIQTALKKFDYRKGKIFIEDENYLYYMAYLDEMRYFISVGVDLNAVKKPLDQEIIKSNATLKRNIIILISTIIVIGFLFFIFTYWFANKMSIKK